MDLLVERCAGLDVAKREVVACVRTPDPGPGGHVACEQQLRCCSQFLCQLKQAVSVGGS